MKNNNLNSIISWVAFAVAIFTFILSVFVPFVGGVLSPGVSISQPNEFDVYHNIRYGFEIYYPKTWIKSSMPTNGDGITIIDPVDPDVQVRVYGAHGIATNFDSGIKKESPGDLWFKYIKERRDNLKDFEVMYERVQGAKLVFDLGNGELQEYNYSIPGILIIRYKHIGPLRLLPCQYEIVSQIKGVGYHCIIQVPWFKSPYYKRLISYIISTFKITPYNGENGTYTLSIESCGKVNLISPKNGKHTHKPLTIVSGMVESPELCPEVYVNGNLVRYGNDGYFSCKVGLIPGRNVIKVVEWYKAFGLDLKTAELSVYYDEK